VWKDLTLSMAGVVALALLLGLLFRWLYPHVELSAELGGLFLLVALVLRLVFGALRGLFVRPPPAGDQPKGPGA
jgi:hypothetical protein